MKKARILINALVDCSKAGIKSGFPMRQMLWGVSTFFECGWLKKENWRTYHRASFAAKLIRESDDSAWKSKVTLEHARPIIKMYQMMLDERATMTVERAAYIIGEYPAILISMEEKSGNGEARIQRGGHAGTALCRGQVFRVQLALGG